VEKRATASVVGLVGQVDGLGPAGLRGGASFLLEAPRGKFWLSIESGAPCLPEGSSWQELLTARRQRCTAQ